LQEVPRLEQVAADPETVQDLDAHVADQLETAAITALGRLRQRKLILVAEARTITVQRADRLLRAREVAARLGMGTDWVYHNQHKLPFRVRLGTVPRFSEKGLEDFIRKRQGT